MTRTPATPATPAEKTRPKLYCHNLWSFGGQKGQKDEEKTYKIHPCVLRLTPFRLTRRPPWAKWAQRRRRWPSLRTDRLWCRCRTCWRRLERQEIKKQDMTLRCVSRGDKQTHFSSSSAARTLRRLRLMDMLLIRPLGLKWRLVPPTRLSTYWLSWKILITFN